MSKTTGITIEPLSNKSTRIHLNRSQAHAYDNNKITNTHNEKRLVRSPLDTFRCKRNQRDESPIRTDTENGDGEAKSIDLRQEGDTNRLLHAKATVYCCNGFVLICSIPFGQKVQYVE